MKQFILPLALCLTACATTQSDNRSSDEQAKVAVQAVQNEADKAEKPQIIPEHRKAYFFEHKLLPKWTFETEGGFFNAMMSGQTEQLIAAATEVVSADYADQISILPYRDQEAVLLIFAQPKRPPNCYFVLIKKTQDAFIYRTYERTIAFDDDNIVGVVGGWDADGSHLNMGGREYSDYQSFFDDIIASE